MSESTERSGTVVTSPDPTKAVNEAIDRVIQLFDRELAGLRREFESLRRELDAIRKFDREEVGKLATRADTNNQTLQSRIDGTAETLSKQQAATAKALADQFASTTGDFNKRLNLLELAGSASAGKSTVADPQMERLSALVEKIASAQSSGSGRGTGMQQLWGWIVGGIGLLVMLWSFLSKFGGGTP